MSSTLESIASILAAALRPLEVLLAGSDQRVIAFVAQLGWSLPDPPPPTLRDIGVQSRLLTRAYARLEYLRRRNREGLASAGEVALAGAAMLTATTAFAAEMNALEARLASELPASFVARSGMPAAFMRRLVDDLVIGHLASAQPVAWAAAAALGLIEEIDLPADSGTEQTAHRRRTVRWDRVGPLLTDGGAVLADVYGWGTSSLQSDAMRSRLDALWTRLAAAPVHERAERPLVQSFSPGAMERPVHSRLPIPISDETILWLGVMTVPATAKQLPGIAITLSAEGVVAPMIQMSAPWEALEIQTSLDLAAGLAVVLRPGAAAEVFIGTSNGVSAPVTAGGLDVMIGRRLDEASPEGMPLLDIGDGSGLWVDAIALTLGLSASSPSPYVGGEVAFEGARLVVRSESAFLAQFLPDEGLSVDFDLAIGWSPDQGIHFAGGVGLEIVFPLTLSILDIATLESLRLGVAMDASSLSLEASTSLMVEIGPIVGMLDRIGIGATFAAPPGGGNLGLLDLSLGFKPPTGLGIGIDLEGVVTGGGYLSIDGGRYAGVGALKFLGVGLTVVGIVETELPEDPDGWSMFLSVIADFTPVPLGFGFFLSGVGGFMGLHRTLDEVALADGAREGRLDSLLFPEDPLADAIRIIADIEAYFPTLPDTHAFGAMARIDWGVPALISGELGVVVVVPDFRIAVVGEIESILPTPEAPLIELHMSVVGYVDPAELTFWVTASIYDSRLVWYALSGDMAMYVSLGDDPYFLLSVGGFHPDWSPPKSVPSTMRSLRRMSAAIDLGEDLQVGLDAYFAVTSNTLQFGAEVFAIARMREFGVDFSAEGSFGFDVLVIFTPFSIVAEMSAEISIKAEGETLLAAQVVLHLEGPEPWYGRATATFTFLGQPINFNVTVGGHVAPDAPDTIDLWDELEPALRDPASWAVPVFDAGTMPEVTLRPLDATIEAGLWLAPDGAIELRQRVVPLNRTIERFGAFVPAGETRFTVDAAGLASATETERHTIEDWFAPAQFVVMRAAERLSAPSFEQMDAGVSFGASGARAPETRDDVAAVDLAYEELVLEDETRGIGVTPFESGLSAIEMWPVLTGGVSMTAERAVSGVTRFDVEPVRYDVADPLDATRVAVGGSYADAVVARRATTATSRTRIVARQEIAA